MSQLLMLGIGEILWDLLPAGRQLGGAPANFAYHAHALGANGVPVSCVGRDALGVEILARLVALGLDPAHIAVAPERPTGTVQVALSTEGKPTFTIMPDVAWDFIALSPALLALAARADAICFGSLAQRAVGSRDTIRACVRQAPATALRIFDINLRQSFYSREIVEASLRLANVLKINDDELPVLAQLLDLTSTGEKARLAEVAARFQLRLVALTKGAEGSILCADERFARHPGLKVRVADSVGAGDAFTAAMALGLLRGWDLERIGTHANRVAAYVCTQPGATPPLPVELCAG